MNEIKEKVEYIQTIFYFLFPESDLTTEDFPNMHSLNTFANEAALFNKVIPDTKIYTNEQLEEIHSLIQDLYSDYWATTKLGQNTDTIDLSEIGLGFDFDIKKYRKILEQAFSLLKQYGLEIYKHK